ncbi:MAG: hypothetical protein A2857_06455 [Candidatus Levybacteria bacterium RIFCSPHIGHO2_01_FULL_36_15]|nr:MAG: hypothetical protein A2857_06455 [Candidatus Levybacteria bacterium RIFCSPHIGHO2_01_FULL_36_15]
MKIKNTQSGQMLLVVVLVMVVALTVGLSVASRTITSLKISKQNEDSQRAFQAAETGIQEALQQLSGNHTVAGILDNQASFNAVINQTSGNQLLLNGGDDVTQDKGMDVWLSGYSPVMYANPIFSATTGTITFYWGTAGQSSCTQGGSASAPRGNTVRPALEILLLYQTPSNPQLRKYLFDACNPVRFPGAQPASSTSTTITDANNPSVSVTFIYSANISINAALNTAFIAKVIPLYNSTKIGVASSISLPGQGSFITSTGLFGDSSRKIQYFKPYPQLPAELFYAIIAQNSN